MNPEEKIKQIKEVLKPVIDWYWDKKKLEATGEIDGSYIYDCLYEQFNDMSRGDILRLVELIVSK